MEQWPVKRWFKRRSLSKIKSFKEENKKLKIKLIFSQEFVPARFALFLSYEETSLFLDFSLSLSYFLLVSILYSLFFFGSLFLSLCISLLLSFSHSLSRYLSQLLSFLLFHSFFYAQVSLPLTLLAPLLGFSLFKSLRRKFSLSLYLS